MVVFPNCKINLGLHILNKREDGFHDIETIFFPVPIEDALEVIVNNNAQQQITYSSSGIEVKGDIANNLCVKAYHLLKRDFPQLPNVRLHLHKAIPMGAGLGGGSADGTFTLTLLNNKFHLNLTEEQLIAYALQLGSDCPFFIYNKPCFATGRGERLKAIELNLSGYFLVIINPGIHINTGWAFKQITPHKHAVSLLSVIGEPVEMWKEGLTNDFEEPVFAQHPEIESIKNLLYQNNAVYAGMTGTGSTVFGIFRESPAPIAVRENYLHKTILL